MCLRGILKRDSKVTYFCALRSVPCQSQAPVFGRVSHSPAAAPHHVVRSLCDAGTTLCGAARIDAQPPHTSALCATCAAVGNPGHPGRAVIGAHGALTALAASGSIDIGVAVDSGGDSLLPAACMGLYSMRTSTGALPLQSSDLPVPGTSCSTIAFTVQKPALMLKVRPHLHSTHAHLHPHPTVTPFTSLPTCPSTQAPVPDSIASTHTRLSLHPHNTSPPSRHSAAHKPHRGVAHLGPPPDSALNPVLSGAEHTCIACMLLDRHSHLAAQRHMHGHTWPSPSLSSPCSPPPRHSVPPLSLIPPAPPINRPTPPPNTVQRTPPLTPHRAAPQPLHKPSHPRRCRRCCTVE